MAFRPRYVTFDCYGTLTRFRMGDMARAMFAHRIEPARMDQFVADFASYRLDEVLALLRKHRVTGILATSRPNDGTRALVEANRPWPKFAPMAYS